MLRSLLDRGFFFILFFLVQCRIFAATTVNVAEELRAIPEEDRQMIHRFFHDLVRLHGFGYTLFGDKPIGMVCFLETANENRKRPYFSVSEEFVQAYSVWKKYQSRFKTEKYLMVERELIVNKKYIDILLIHKENFFSTIEKYPNYFEEGYSPRLFVEKEKVENYDADKRSKYHIKMGLLLGYGIENTLKFAELDKNHMRDSVQMVPFVKVSGFQKGRGDVLPMTFAVDPNLEETKELVIKYSEIRARLNTIISQENFLPLVLEEYCSKIPCPKGLRSRIIY